MFDYLVIGKGLIGSAAFRYLSKESANTAVLGPDEPADPSQHDGVFGAWHDEGRLARRLSHDSLWGKLGQRAYATYHQIEQESGIRFFTETGGMTVVHPERNRDFLDATDVIGRLFDIDYELLNHEQWGKQFPYLSFDPDYLAVYEKKPAGFLNPREMVRAQVRAGRLNGGTVIRETAVSVQEADDHVVVTTREGQTIQAKRVLLATGAFSNSFDLFQRKLALRTKPERVTLAQVPESEAKRLADMPTVIYYIDSPDVGDLYMVRPVPYPDGNFYLKMGGNTREDQYVTSFEEMNAWYREGTESDIQHALEEALLSIFPNLKVLGWEQIRCVITYTVHGQPYIDQHVPGKIYTAIGGNGHSAKSSDALGAIAANLVIHDEWRDGLPQEKFRLWYADEEFEWSHRLYKQHMPSNNKQ